MAERTGALVGGLVGRSAAVAKEQVASTIPAPPPILQILFIPAPIPKLNVDQTKATFILTPHCNSFAVVISPCSQLTPTVVYLFQHRLDASTGGRNGRFETEAADDLFKNSVVLRRSRELCDDFAAPA
jgi:hypothetical protein